MGRDPCGSVAGALVLCATLLVTGPACADDPFAALTAALPPGARETGRSVDPDGTFDLPVGPASPTTAPPVRRRDGQRQRIAWVWSGDDAQGVATRMTGAMADAGFDTLYACQTDDCGGFDFRLALPVLPLPDMVVNLADFRYVVGARASPPALAALLVSGMEGRTHAQVTLVLPPSPASPTADPAVPSHALTEDVPRPAGDADVITRLDTDGRAVLPGLAFAPGSTTLETEDSDALSDLAAWLAADPARRVALVGHTDWTGTPEANLAVSRARAAAVGAALAARGTDPDRITIAGVGSFAPRAPNTTPEGQAANRRVEAVRLPDMP